MFNLLKFCEHWIRVTRYSLEREQEEINARQAAARDPELHAPTGKHRNTMSELMHMITDTPPESEPEYWTQERIDRAKARGKALSAALNAPAPTKSETVDAETVRAVSAKCNDYIEKLTSETGEHIATVVPASEPTLAGGNGEPSGDELTNGLPPLPDDVAGLIEAAQLVKRYADTIERLKQENERLQSESGFALKRIQQGNKEIKRLRKALKQIPECVCPAHSIARAALATGGEK